MIASFFLTILTAFISLSCLIVLAEKSSVMLNRSGESGHTLYFRWILWRHCSLTYKLFRGSELRVLWPISSFVAGGSNRIAALLQTRPGGVPKWSQVRWLWHSPMGCWVQARSPRFPTRYLGAHLSVLVCLAPSCLLTSSLLALHSNLGIPVRLPISSPHPLGYRARNGAHPFLSPKNSNGSFLKSCGHALTSGPGSPAAEDLERF